MIREHIRTIILGVRGQTTKKNEQTKPTTSTFLSSNDANCDVVVVTMVVVSA